MNLKEYLEIYKSAKKIYIEEYIDIDDSKQIALFQNRNLIDIIPNEYLNSEVLKWNYKLNIVDLKNIVAVPVAVIKIRR